MCRYYKRPGKKEGGREEGGRGTLHAGSRAGEGKPSCFSWESNKVKGVKVSGSRMRMRQFAGRSNLRRAAAEKRVFSNTLCRDTLMSFVKRESMEM